MIPSPVSAESIITRNIIALPVGDVDIGLPVTDHLFHIDASQLSGIDGQPLNSFDTQESQTIISFVVDDGQGFTDGPLFVANAQNGLPVLRSVIGVNGGYQSAVIYNPGFGPGLNKTIYIVANASSTVGGQGELWAMKSANSSFTELNSNGFFRQFLAGKSFLSNTPPITRDVASLTGIRMPAPSGLEVSFDGVLIHNTSLGILSANMEAGLFDLMNDNGFAWRGDFMEMVFYDRLVTDEEDSEITDFLMNKWGI